LTAGWIILKAASQKSVWAIIAFSVIALKTLYSLIMCTIAGRRTTRNAMHNALDLYAAANTYPEEGAVLARLTQEAAVRYAQNKATKTELRTLLAFAHALAYLDDDLYEQLRDTF